MLALLLSSISIVSNTKLFIRCWFAAAWQWGELHSLVLLISYIVSWSRNKIQQKDSMHWVKCFFPMHFPIYPFVYVFLYLQFSVPSHEWGNILFSFSLLNLNVPSTTKLYFCKLSLQPLMSSMKCALTLFYVKFKVTSICSFPDGSHSTFIHSLISSTTQPSFLIRKKRKLYLIEEKSHITKLINTKFLP